MTPSLPDIPEPHTGNPAASRAPSTIFVLLCAAVPFVLKTFSFLFLTPNYGMQSIYKIGQLLVPVIWRRQVLGKRRWAVLWPVDEPLPDRMTTVLAILVAIASAGASIVAVLSLASYLGVDPRHIREHLTSAYSFNPSTAVIGVVFLSTLNAGFEELHFRVWLDRELSQRWGDLAGILVSTSLFAAMHMFIFAKAPGVTLAALALLFFALFVGGAAWSLLARRPGGIHAAWLAHGLTDAILLSWGLWWLGMFATS